MKRNYKKSPKLQVHPVNPDVKNYVLRAQATLDLDFSLDVSNPKITIESNTIDFGHPVVKKLFEQRSWFQYFKDCIQYFLGMNKVLDLSTVVSDLPKINDSAAEPQISPMQSNLEDDTINDDGPKMM